MVFAPSEADRLLKAVMQSKAKEAAIRAEIPSGAVRQSRMEAMFDAHGLA